MKRKYSIKTKCGIFDALISFDRQENRYFVTLPAFPGVMTEARSLFEAKKYAGEIITLACLDALDQGKLVVDNTKHVYGNSVGPGAVTLA